MEKATRIDRFTAPFGGQDIELAQVEYESGGMPLLRLRIREKHRFTIFEIDPATATRWGQAMINWAGQHAASHTDAGCDGACQCERADAPSNAGDRPPATRFL